MSTGSESIGISVRRPRDTSAMTSAALESCSDERLAKEAAGGSRTHFDQVVRRYSDLLYRVCYHMTNSNYEAEEATQEAFLKAFRFIDGFDCSKPLRPWLVRIAVNTVRSRFRARSRRVEEVVISHDLPGGGNGPESATAAKIDLERALKTLGRTQREVVVLRGIEEFTFPEIGEVLGMPEATARTIFHRAKKALESELS